MDSLILATLAGFALAAFIVYLVWTNILYSRSTKREKEEVRDESRYW